MLAGHRSDDFVLRTRNKKSLRPRRKFIHNKAAGIFAPGSQLERSWRTLAEARHPAATRAVYSLSGTDSNVHFENGETGSCKINAYAGNSKPEIRNPKQTRRLKFKRACAGDAFFSFGFRICFEFRDSNVGFRFEALTTSQRLWLYNCNYSA